MGASAFDTSGREMTIVFGVPVALAVEALGYFPFSPGGLEFDFALIEYFYIKDGLVVRCRLEIHEKHGQRQFCAILSDIPDIRNLVTKLFNRIFDFFCAGGEVHIAKNYTVMALLFGPVGMEFCIFC
jgi:hypothetical protein